MPLKKNQLSLEEVRNIYHQSIDNELIIRELKEKLHKIPQKSPVLLAYQGASEALLGKFSKNVFEKFVQVQKAKILLNAAVTASPEDIEIRYLRFSIHHHLPTILQEEKYLEDDKKMILKKIQTIDYQYFDKEIQTHIIRYLLACQRCSPEEINFLKNLL